MWVKKNLFHEFNPILSYSGPKIKNFLRISRLYCWFKSYSNFAECVNFANRWTCIWKGLRAACEESLFKYLIPRKLNINISSHNNQISLESRSNIKINNVSLSLVLDRYIPNLDVARILVQLKCCLIHSDCKMTITNNNTTCFFAGP